jgi:hypothetical protein
MAPGTKAMGLGPRVTGSTVYHKGLKAFLFSFVRFVYFVPSW